MLAKSRPLILDPLSGHPESSLHVTNLNLRGTTKELAQLDVSRHIAAANMSAITKAVGIVVSESSVVRLFCYGQLVGEIIPEVWMMNHAQLGGAVHEQRYLRGLAEKDGLAIAQIDVNGHWDDAVAETVRALRDGDAVYQATFLDGQWGGGRADFLVRVNKPSTLGSWSYEVVETKLARSTKATALVQLCFYSKNFADCERRKAFLETTQMGDTPGSDHHGLIV